MSKILLIDTEKPLHESLQATLEPKGYDILDAAGLETGLEMALAHLPDAIVAQVAAGRLEARPLQGKLGEWAATALIPVILITDASAQMTLRETLKEGDDLLIQPVSAEVLILALEACLRKTDLRRHRAEGTKARLQTILEAASDLAGMLEGKTAGLPESDPAGRKMRLLDAVGELGQRHEKGLLEHEGKSGSMLDDIGIGIYRGTTDPRGRFLHANPAMARMFGYASVPELMATAIADLYENAAEREMFVREVTRHHAVKSRVLRMRRRNGDRFWVAVTAQIRYDAHGGMKWVEGILQDVTEHQQAEVSLARDRDLLWALMDCIPDQIYFKDTASKFTRINRQQARILGLASPDEAVGKSDYDFFDHASQAFADEQIIMTSRRPLINKTEFIRTATGEYRWVSSTKAPIVNAAGEVIGLVGITRDIHETKVAEEALAQRAGLALLTAQVGNALIQKSSLRGILQTCAEAIVTRLDAAFARIWTLNETGEALDLQASAGLYTHLDGAHGRIPVGQFKIGLIAHDRKPHLTNSVIGDPRVGDQAWAEREGMVAFAGYPLIIGGRLVGVLGMFARHPLSDTILATLGSVADAIALGIEQKRAELMLRQSEELFRLITENAADLISVSNREGQRIYQSPSYEKSLGYTALEVRRMPPLATIHPDDRAKITASIQESFRNGQIQRLEYRVLHKDGSCRQIEATSSVALNPEKLPESIVVVARDITERKQAEQERHLMEAQLRQAQKLEAIGQLAAGIAHEINTPTQYIGDNTRFLRDGFKTFGQLIPGYRRLLQASEAGPPPPALLAELNAEVRAADLDYLLEQVPAAIQETLEGIARVAKIVRAMKEFSHPGSKEPTAVDLHRNIENTITVARNEWKYVAEVKTDFDPLLPPVRCFAGEFNQVILNLLVNAAQAIGETQPAQPDAKGLITVSTRKDGEWAEIRLADTGPGVPPEARPHLFEPFFTTKEVGKGTGQGLATVYAMVVKKHGGTVTFETEVGRGTTFIVRLPLGSLKTGVTSR